MHSKLSTLDSALQFRYFGNERLYTDHEGRRVIVDVEGSGVMRLVHAVPPVLLIRSENLYPEFTPEFKNGAIVLANGSGEVFVQVLAGRNGSVVGEPLEVDGNYEGCGWVIESPKRFSIDNRHELAPEPDLNFPVPFFRSIAGPGTRTIVPCKAMRCDLVDQFDIGDALALKAHDFKVQNLSKLTEMSSTYSDGTSRTAMVASHLNVASFRVTIPAENSGLILRRTYDRFHGRQRARVHVDGNCVGWWFEGGEDRNSRWHVSDFGIPSGVSAGKSTIQIAIDPPAGVALWSISRIEVFALVDTEPG